jgi:2-dehydro-3-deoxyphosphogluconate aldolase/(4S)-4-hydroxy-2-oxoglutarate aldolase
MDNDSFLALLRQHRAIAVIRAPTVEVGLQLAHAAEAGGLRLIEITWNSANPEELVNQLRCQLPHCTIGIGTALALADLKAAETAGSQFCFCPPHRSGADRPGPGDGNSHRARCPHP